MECEVADGTSEALDVSGTLNIELPYLFKPREYQLGIMTQVPQYYSRGVFIHHRRAGKDKSAWNKMIKEAIKKTAIYYYFFPTYKQGRKAIWDAIDPATGFKFLDHIPKELLKKKNDTEMKLTLINDSIIQIVGVDNFDMIMGTAPYGCVFSEYALQDPKAWDYIRPILRENKGWAIFVYTPRGLQNHGYELYKTACASEDWYVEIRTVDDTRREDGTRVVSEEDIRKEREERMPEELIDQEYFCSFEGYIQGAYYAKQMLQAQADGRISDNVSYIQNLEVYTAWDLGVDDSTTIWFFQVLPMPLQYRFIDYYENSGEGMAHYAKVIKDKGYVYGDHFLPHDGDARKLGETAESPRQILERLGIRSIVVVKRPRDIQAVMRGIQAVRNSLSQSCFHKQKCIKGVVSLQNYHAEYDDDKKKLGDHPEHDYTSHACDAMRTFAVGFSPRTTKRVSVTQRMNARFRRG